MRALVLPTATVKKKFGSAPIAGVCEAIRKERRKLTNRLDFDDALLVAIRNGKLADARTALAQGASPNAASTLIDETGCIETLPALYEACWRQNELMVRLLLKSGADPNSVWSRRGEHIYEEIPCLMFCIHMFEIVKVMLQNGADPNKPSTLGEGLSEKMSPLEYVRTSDVRMLLMRFGAHKA